VRRLWVHRSIDAPAAAVWALLTNVERWPEWGPAVRRAELTDGDFDAGAVGFVTTTPGVRLPFEITAFEPGVGWTWNVAGVPATDHRVEPLGADRCRAGFGVPLVAAPYLAVCVVALRRLESIATVQRVAA
jgi:hypothetical protein